MPPWSRRYAASSRAAKRPSWYSPSDTGISTWLCSRQIQMIPYLDRRADQQFIGIDSAVIVGVTSIYVSGCKQSPQQTNIQGGAKNAWPPSHQSINQHSFNKACQNARVHLR